MPMIANGLGLASGAVCLLSIFSALDTATENSPGGRVRIFCRVGMTLRTMCFGQLSSAGDFSRHSSVVVNFSSDRFQVRRVDAVANPAQVIKLQPIRNFSNMKNVRSTMRWLSFRPFPPSKTSIATAFFDRAQPYPARSAII